MPISLSDLEFISMIVNRPQKLFPLSILCIALTGCGLDFGAGGASLEGTGNGQPPAPGLGNAGDDNVGPPSHWEQSPMRLTLGAAAIDACNMLIREILFIDPKTQNVLYDQQDVAVNFDQSGTVPIEVYLSLDNVYNKDISIEYPSCDVPMMLQNNQGDTQYFPIRECTVSKTEIIAPQQTRSFHLKYKLDQPIEGQWSVHPKLKITVPDMPQEECQPLVLPIGLKLQQSNVDQTLNTGLVREDP